MSLPIDSHIFLWLISVWQPVSVQELCRIMDEEFPDYFEDASEEKVRRVCLRFTKRKLLVRTNRVPDLFSLSIDGNEALPLKIRLLRDKARLFLLKEVRRVALNKEVSGVLGLGGVSPSTVARDSEQGGEASGLASFVPTGQNHWLRHAEQFLKTGHSTETSDLSVPKFLSFYEPIQLEVSSKSSSLNELRVGKATVQLALALGVSYQLISSMIRKQGIYYQAFEIPKKSGGKRTIEAPRVFMKVVQRFILDYYLSSLPIHKCVTSFKQEQSSVTNASLHCGQSYVGTIDIENFFGSITKDSVAELLIANHYPKDVATLFASLCTKDGVLPQGAPTSPVISNSLLYDFDEIMSDYASYAGLIYSRYADDITVSGPDKEKVRGALGGATFLLSEFSFNINRDKTRVMSKFGRQIVTGLVVNEKVQPVRRWRRYIRVAFYKASSLSSISKIELNKLRGYYGYLASMPDAADNPALKKYRKVLTDLNDKVDDDAS